jgi:hypothetical protein
MVYNYVSMYVMLFPHCMYVLIQMVTLCSKLWHLKNEAIMEFCFNWAMREESKDMKVIKERKKWSEG